ncbi:MAG: LamG-like jellyroll fold domain-containing protein [Phycisphaerae bacterium]
MKKQRTRQAGIAMLLVLTTIAMATVLGLSYVCVTTVKAAGSANLLKASRSRYLAESGLHHALHLLRTNSPGIAAAMENSPLGPFHADGTDDSYVLYSQQTAPTSYTVTAKGTCRGLTRTSSVRVRLINTYESQMQALGPYHYWRLGELVGPTAWDEQGRSNGRYYNGVLFGQPGVLAGDPDKAAHFDGLNDYVDMGKTTEVDGDRLTLLVWFKADDFASPMARLISKAKPPGTFTWDHLWMLRTAEVGGEMRLRFLLKTDDGVADALDASSGDLEAGKWTFAAATYGGGYMRLYKDGEKVGQMAKTGNVDGDDEGLELDTWIGNNPGDFTSRPFHGLIDEVAIFKKRLTDDEIRALYEAWIASAKLLSWHE